MSERRLAAIMFTDIVGYTAFMGSDEDRAFEVLKKNIKGFLYYYKALKSGVTTTILYFEKTYNYDDRKCF